MTYPQSSDVAPAQPTLAAHYNNLRSDALRLGQANADTVDLAAFLKRYVQGVTLTYLATNRLRIIFNASLPPTLMINGFMLQAYANVDLPAGMFSGAAAIWYVFAVRSAGSSTFTLTVNTSPVEGTDQRLIGQVTWDGSNITSVTTLVPTFSQLPIADYDSGWFACAAGGSYFKAHGLAQFSRLIRLYHCADSAGAGEWAEIGVVQNSASTYKSAVHCDATNVIVNAGATGFAGTAYTTRRESSTGFYRILAWK
jgi:hypothetical protein